MLTTAIAIARSLSVNHVLMITIYELRKIELTLAIINVPIMIGKNVSVAWHPSLTIAPVNIIIEAALNTRSTRNLLKRYTARKSDGGEKRAKDMAHKLTGIVEDSS